MAEKAQTKMPYHVTTTDGAFHSGQETLEQAEAACKAANAEATTLGIKTRYEVKEGARL